jgi:hypothetical protein
LDEENFLTALSYAEDFVEIRLCGYSPHDDPISGWVSIKHRFFNMGADRSVQAIYDLLSNPLITVEELHQQFEKRDLFNKAKEFDRKNKLTHTPQ